MAGLLTMSIGCRVQGWNSFNQSLTAYEMGVYGWVVDAQFVIALGDNFYNDGTESTEDELWETAFHDVYAAPSLNIPWYGVLGNHGKCWCSASEYTYTHGFWSLAYVCVLCCYVDYHGSIDSQIARSSVADETMWTMPATYYVKNYEVADGGIMTIVYIDTQLLDPYQHDTEDILSDEHWKEDKQTHLYWIIDQLEEYSKTSQWLFVAGHYPIISIGEHGDDQYLIDDLLHILLKYRVHAYLCGHDHLHSHVYKGGLHHIISGNSAGRGPFDEQATAYLETSAAVGYIENYFTDCGFIIASASAYSVNFTFMNNLGKIKYVAALDAPMNLDLVQKSATTHLKSFGLPPKVVGTIIFIPSLTIVVSIIVFLSKDFLNKLLNNDESNEKPNSGLQQQMSIRRDKDYDSHEMDRSMDSSTWSDLDTSSARLAPSRHGR